MRSLLRPLVLGGILATLSVVAVACGGDDDGGGGAQDVNAAWLYTGPEDDGGWNVAMLDSEAAMAEVGGVKTTSTFELPYTQRLTQVAKQALAQGSNVLVDTLGAGALIRDVCKENPAPTSYCLIGADPAKQPPNSRAWWAQDWDFGWVAGVAAGMTTKTDQLGLIGAFDLPLVRQAVNTYALGCQSVNPDCEVRVTYINTFFDPAKEKQAAKSLINAGADVLRNWVDSPTTCQTAAEEGVWAVTEFLDQTPACPDSNIFSTVWDLDDYVQDQAEAIKNDEFVGGKIDLIEGVEGDGGPHLGEYGDFVPDDVRDKVDETWSQIVDGQDLIVGPIRDENGKLRFKDGEVVPKKFMYSKWTWYVDGVIAGK